MVNRHVKGSVWRRKVCAWFEARGCTPRFRSIGEAGDDVTVAVGKVTFSIEAKNHKAHDFAGWLTQAEQNAPVGQVAVVMAHRRGRDSVAGGYVVMSGETFGKVLDALEGAR